MIVDIIVAIVLVLSALIALIRGFIREVLTIVGVVGGLIGAYFAGPLVSPLIYGWFNVDETTDEPQRLFDIIPYTMVADGLAYGSIFLGVVIVLSLVSHILAESAKTVGLGIVDRGLGTAFGVLRGILLVALMYLPFYLLLDNETKKAWFDQSVSHPYLEQTAGVIASYIPEDTIEKWEQDAGKFADNMKKTEAIKDVVDRAADPDAADTPLDAEPSKDGSGAAQDDAPAPAPSDPDDVYSVKFRQKMDEMFQNQGAGGADQPSQAPSVDPGAGQAP